ncbi:Oxidoreductase FAD/NAD(P)-binding protein [Heliorestis convoluta]|uniref:Oxidoreductase FAD/NAD(P)-binding protein n=2 Tax=Heliorestis convoluta TaxID=356322 RepID=A0A5Q2N2J0_9FIRM|nr:FAD/NAD(P)-binding protein [Heliorestis convoluta]QGG47806.1 Oxidoreductase FAD/NAD(P)-binding protein [Heliorestis convoluta]
MADNRMIAANQTSATTADIKRINPLVPMKAKVTKIIEETPDVKTFYISKEENGQMVVPFHTEPGQLAMLSLPGVGEAMFSATDAPDHLQLSIKKVGMLTNELHEIVPGQTVGIRGPYGNGFPMERIKGKNVLFIGGGIGLAPVRTAVRYCVDHRDDYGKLHLIYGSRSPADLVFQYDLFETWPALGDFKVSVTVDRGDDSWKGNVGFVPAYLEELKPDPDNSVCIICGPPIMIKFTLGILDKLGFTAENVITTLEMRMKCGIGKCGRCNIGSCFVCLDGPVFSLAEMKKMPNEY